MSTSDPRPESHAGRHPVVVSLPARLVRLGLRPLRRWWPWPRRPRDPKDPTGQHDLQPERVRDKVRVQVGIIRDAFDPDPVGVATATGDDGDAEYFFDPHVVLVRTSDVETLRQFFEQNSRTYRGTGDSGDEPVPGLTRYLLPPRTDGGRPDVQATLDEVDRELGEGVVTPDHLIYVLPRGTGTVCPATEPAEPPYADPLPAAERDQSLGKEVRVSVVDTGWHPPAATNPLTPWLAGVDGDVETLFPAALHPYAGHGTFVSGIVRCLAPATEVTVEGFLTRGGAVWESEITRQLNEAMTDRDRPQLISISAGGRSRKSIGMIAFEVLSQAQKLTEGADAPLVVAAAGNDGSDVPIWPAAFDWVVSVGALDDDGAVSDFSNVGTWVDVYAHGRDLVNAFPIGTYTCYEPEHQGEVRHFKGLAQWSGTSFSTPLVTGLIAAGMTGATPARDVWGHLMAGALSRTDPRAGTIKVVGPPFV